MSQSGSTACPILYEETRGVTEAHYAEIFPLLETKLKWKTNGLIFDHGCGSGSTTFNYVLPIAKKLNSKIIALDNSLSMVEYARENYSNDRIEYVHGEVSVADSPVQGLKFDVILSLYVFHFAQDYESQLKALRQLLTDDGEIFMIFVLHAPSVGLYAKLLDDDDWSADAKGHLIAPEYSLKSENEDECVKTAFIDAGFDIKSWERKERTHVYRDVEQWADFIFSLNSFAKNLPKEKHDRLREIYHTYFRETETKTYKPNSNATKENGNTEGDLPYVMHYEVVIVHANTRTC